eukprot:scaffold128628_cov33-Phaeocystis_antarctica.AAC.1
MARRSIQFIRLDQNLLMPAELAYGYGLGSGLGFATYGGRRREQALGSGPRLGLGLGFVTYGGRRREQACDELKGEGEDARLGGG